MSEFDQPGRLSVQSIPVLVTIACLRDNTPVYIDNIYGGDVDNVLDNYI